MAVEGDPSRSGPPRPDGPIRTTGRNAHSTRGHPSGDVDAGRARALAGRHQALIASVEAERGARLPVALRRTYREAADGGFGPGGGLLSLAAAMEACRGLRGALDLPSGSTWPDGLLPILEVHPGYTCVDVRSGQVVDWDPEELTERSGEKAWQQSFSVASQTVETRAVRGDDA